MTACGCEKWRAAGWRVWCASCRRGDPEGYVVSGTIAAPDLADAGHEPGCQQYPAGGPF